jgi:hypothetical protein
MNDRWIIGGSFYYCCRAINSLMSGWLLQLPRALALVAAPPPLQPVPPQVHKQMR